MKKDKSKRKEFPCPVCGNEQLMVYRKAMRCRYCESAIVWQGNRVKEIGRQDESDWQQMF